MWFLFLYLLLGVILYSLVTPIFCCFGIFGNILSLMVLKRKELVGSVYTYLAAAVDLCMSIVLLLGGISRGVMWQQGWCVYDSLIGLPLGGALNTISILAIIGLTLDRVIYLWNPVQCTKPKFCYPEVARRLMFISLVIAIVFNLPYCFIYTWGSDGNTLVTTPFFDSKFYRVFNWITLIIFAVLPAIILLFGNGFLILSLRKARQINRKSNRKKGNRRDHTNLTITLVMIIVFFLISNIPENLVSRTAAINLLFQGDHNRANTETIENLRQICTLLGAVNVTVNFIFYYTFCPAFCKALKKVCGIKEKIRVSKSLQVNVFVLNANSNEIGDKCLNQKVKAKVLEISRKSIESAFSISLGEIEKEKPKIAEFPNNENKFITSGGEYVDLDEYAPPFSTIMEESTISTNTDISNKS